MVKKAKGGGKKSPLATAPQGGSSATPLSGVHPRNAPEKIIESLFDIPPGWESLTLGDACERGGGDVQTGPFGSQLHAADYVPIGIPSIMPQNIGDNRINEDGIARIKESDAARLTKYRLKEGDIVYSRRGDVERRALVRNRENGWLCGTGCLRIRFGTGHVFPTFAAHYLGHPMVREWIVRHAHGATMPNLNTSILSALPMVLPPYNAQESIAHILSSLDDKIENNRRMNETLEAMARALFKDWFVDFGPVRAKMEGREPPGLSPEVAALFPDSMNTDDVPSGWEMKALGEVISLNPTEKMSKEFVSPYLEMSALSTTNSWPDDLPVPREFGSGMKFRNGDTLLARITPCLENGKTALIQCLNENEIGWGSTEFIVMRPKGDVPPEYCYVLARSEAFRDHAIQSMTGTSGRQRVQANSISGFNVSVPDRAIWRAFEAFCRPLFNSIKVNSLQSLSLSDIRNCLLPKLLAGDISVHEVERVMT